MADEKKDSKKEWKEKKEKTEMTLEEAKAYRASLHKAQPVELDDAAKREQFRLFWAQNKHKYGRGKDLEQILWVHIKSAKLDKPEQFEAGIAHFGLKKIR
jgi:hypothetical protein